MARRLTETSVERLGIKATPYDTYDAIATGLMLRVTPAGKKIWMLRAVYPGHNNQTRRTLGQYPGLKLAAAREKAERWYGWIKEGIDPERKVEEEARFRAEEHRKEAIKRGNTFRGVAEKYIEDRAANRRAVIDAREIRRMLIPEWGDKPIHEITPRDVRALIDRLKVSAGTYDAHNAWTHLFQIFKLAVHTEAIEVSPCASLDKGLLFKNAPKKPRQRVLNDAEVRALWLATDKLLYPFGPFYKLLLLTGTRLEELAEAKWTEFDFDKALWTVPRERFKSDSDHLVPLSADALAVLESIPRVHGNDGQDGESPFLFTKRRIRNTERKPGEKPPPFHPISGFGKGKAELDEKMLATLRESDRAAKIEHWKNHDLRRVVRTNLSALDIPDHICEAALGHGKRGLARIYDMHRYEPQIRDALNRWAERIRAIVSPSKKGGEVVKLKAKRGVR